MSNDYWNRQPEEHPDNNDPNVSFPHPDDQPAANQVSDSYAPTNREDFGAGQYGADPYAPGGYAADAQSNPSTNWPSSNGFGDSQAQPFSFDLGGSSPYGQSSQPNFGAPAQQFGADGFGYASSGYSANPYADNQQSSFNDDPYGQNNQAFGAQPYEQNFGGQSATSYGQDPYGAGPQAYGQTGFNQDQNGFGNSAYQNIDSQYDYGQNSYYGQSSYGTPSAPSDYQQGYEQQYANYGESPNTGYGQALYGPVMGNSAPLAHFGKRALNYAIDYLLPFLVISGGQELVDGGGAGAAFGWLLSLAGVAFMVYNTGYLGGTTGQSYGRKIANTRLVSEQTGQPIGFGMAVIRYFAHIVDFLPCNVGWLWPLWDAKRQTFADKIMGTVVIDEDPAANSSYQMGPGQQGSGHPGSGPYGN